MQGKSLLHLQCHFGLDTLSWARRGARVTGVDFSEKAVAHARRLARELAIEARFLCADVTDTAAVLAQLEGDQFDVVFTSHGAITWLPDLRPWARTIAGRPQAGRHLLHSRLSSVHAGCSTTKLTEPELRFRYEYFGREGLRWEQTGSYAAPDADFKSVWLLLAARLRGDRDGRWPRRDCASRPLREYPYLYWQWFPWMVKNEDGTYCLPEGLPRIPLMFSLTATKPPAS